MDYLGQFIDLRRLDSDPELFGIALALRHMRVLIQHGGSDMRRPDDDSALQPHHLESFLTRAVAVAWKDTRLAQEWRKLQRVLLRTREAWEKGQRLFQEAFERAGGDQESMEYLSQIDFAVDSYAYVAALNTYPRDEALQNWVINGYMLAWREHFLKDQEGEGHMEREV